MFTLVISRPAGRKKSKFRVRNDKSGKFVFESWARKPALDTAEHLTALAEARRLIRNGERRLKAAAKKAAKAAKVAA